MDKMIAAIVNHDVSKLKTLLAANKGLVTRLVDREQLLEFGIFHWIYVGDSLLHVASAGYRVHLSSCCWPLAQIQMQRRIGAVPHRCTTLLTDSSPGPHGTPAIRCRRFGCY
jgi:hypothetical protein